MGKLALTGGERIFEDKEKNKPVWPRVGEEAIEAVAAALRKSSEDTRYLSAPAGGGPVEEFEKAFAETMGTTHAITTSGGGPALHIAMMAAGVQAGDEVIVSPYTWGQTVSCILQQNAIPIFADIDPVSYNLDPDAIEARITPHTKAIVVVHIFGQPADMDPIMDIARRHNLRVIEDCAQAVGARYKGRYVGTSGNFGCFSIGDGKNIVGGEGGVLITDDEYLWRRANVMGMHPARHRQLINGDPELEALSDSLIYTYRIHPLSAVICGTQLPQLDEWNAERRTNAVFLSEGLEDIPGISPPVAAPDREHVFHIYAPRFEPEELDGVSRVTFVKALQAEGVPLSLGYVRTPVHLRRTFQRRSYFYGRGCPWHCFDNGRRVEYRRGDCAVAERHCSEHELMIGGSTGWLGDQRHLLLRYLDAFTKVGEHLDELRQYEQERGEAS